MYQELDRLDDDRQPAQYRQHNQHYPNDSVVDSAIPILGIRTGHRHTSPVGEGPLLAQGMCRYAPVPWMSAVPMGN